MSDYVNDSDEKLLDAIRLDDEKAFAELFNRHWLKAHILAYSKIHNKEVTEEIVQDLFMTLWDKRATLFINNISAYIYTSVKHKALNYIESRIVRKKYWDYYKVFVPQAEDSTEKIVNYNELLDAIERGMEYLPKKTKTIFKLSRLEGRSISEIAKLLNLSEKAIEYHLTNSLKQMRMYLKDSIIVLMFCGLILS